MWRRGRRWGWAGVKFTRLSAPPAFVSLCIFTAANHINSSTSIDDWSVDVARWMLLLQGIVGPALPVLKQIRGYNYICQRGFKYRWQLRRSRAANLPKLLQQPRRHTAHSSVRSSCTTPPVCTPLLCLNHHRDSNSRHIVFGSVFPLGTVWILVFLSAHANGKKKPQNLCQKLCSCNSLTLKALGIKV